MPDELSDKFLKSEKFHSLEPADQVELLRRVDPTFASLPPQEQGKRINDARSLVAPMSELHPQNPQFSPLQHVGNFAGTLGKDALSIPGNMYQAFAHPIDTAKGMYQQSAEQAGKAKDAYNQGNYGEMLARGAATFPMIGPMAANAGEEIGKGDIGTGLAHGAEALMMGAPRMIGAPVIKNTLGRAPGVAPVARAVSKGVEAAIPAKVSKVFQAAKEGYKGTKTPEISDLEQFDSSTRKVSRPLKVKDAGRTTDDLNPTEPKQAAAPIDKGKMVKRGTTTNDLNPVEETEAKPKAAPIDKSKMVKRETTTEDLNPEKPLTPRKAKQAERDELLANTRKVSRPAKSSGPGRTTDDLNQTETQQKPAPVDKGIVSRVERAKKLATEETEESPPINTETPKTKTESPYSSETPEKPGITQQQIDAAQNEYRVPKANRYAKHLHDSGYDVSEVGNMSHEQWKAFAEETGEYLPSTATIDKIKGEMTRLKRESTL